MNRNPLIPFLLIFILGIGLMFMLSFKGLGDAKDLASEKSGKGEKTEETSKNPEDIYANTCAGCHGAGAEGGVGPELNGVGDHLSLDEVKDVIANGRGTMPPNLVGDAELDGMAEYIHGLKK